VWEYPWEKPYTIKPKHDVLAIIRETIPKVIDIRPVITPIQVAWHHIGWTPKSRKDAGERPLPVLEVECATAQETLWVNEIRTRRLTEGLNQRHGLPLSYRALGSSESTSIFVMVSNVYARHGDNPTDEEKRPFREALDDLRVAVDSLIYERFGINVPELKRAYAEKLRREGRVKTQADVYEAENTIDRALSAESKEYGIRKRSAAIEQIIKELTEDSQRSAPQR
jgi:hypothetical protein